MSIRFVMSLRRPITPSVSRNPCASSTSDPGVRIVTVIAVLSVRRTGSVRPSKIGGYKPRAIAGEHRTWLLARIKEKDFTLLGLVGELAERGLKVDYRSVWTFVHDEKLSFKKKRGGWRTRSSRRGSRRPTARSLSIP